MIYDAVHQAVPPHEKHGTRPLELAALFGVAAAQRAGAAVLCAGRSSTKTLGNAPQRKGRMPLPQALLGDMVEMRSEL